MTHFNRFICQQINPIWYTWYINFVVFPLIFFFAEKSQKTKKSNKQMLSISEQIRVCKIPTFLRIALIKAVVFLKFDNNEMKWNDMFVVVLLLFFPVFTQNKFNRVGWIYYVDWRLCVILNILMMMWCAIIRFDEPRSGWSNRSS